MRDLTTQIGTTGDRRNKLGVCVGLLTLSQRDEDTRAVITRAFAIARRDDVAICVHLDDQMLV